MKPITSTGSISPINPAISQATGSSAGLQGHLPTTPLPPAGPPQPPTPATMQAAIGSASNPIGEVKAHLDALDAVEKGYQVKLTGIYSNATDIKSLEEKDTRARNSVNDELHGLNKLLEGALVRLERAYNDASPREKAEMEPRIAALTRRINQRNSSQNSRRLAEAKLHLFKATVLKRLTLQARARELRDKSSNWPWGWLNKFQAWKIEKELYSDKNLTAQIKAAKVDIGTIEGKSDQELAALHKAKKRLERLEAELGRAPSREHIDFLRGDLISEISADDEILSASQIKEQHSRANTLFRWGGSHLNHALKMPSNWTPIYCPIIRTAPNGAVDIRMSVATPLTENPAGLRKRNRAIPTNLHRQVSYKVGDPKRKEITYRGGAWGDQCAETALRLILQDYLEQTGRPLTTFQNVGLLTLMTKIGRFDIKPDRTLFSNHKEGIEKAFEALEKNPPEGYTPKDIALLREGLPIGNTGTNEGAMGHLEIGGVKVPFRLGWHESVNHLNQATKELNALVDAQFEKAKTDEEAKRTLGAFYHHVLKVEEKWASLSFTHDKEGGQFDFAADLAVLTQLASGGTTYIHCMSGKDRTGGVVGTLDDNLTELDMQLADYVKQLGEYAVEKGLDPAIAHPLLTREDIDTLAENPVASADNLINRKMDAMHSNLRQHRLTPHKIDMKGTAGTFGIERHEVQASRVASIPNPFSHRPVSADRHRLAVNRRRTHMAGPALAITGKNTGFYGSKVKGGRSLDRSLSGFDAEFVTEQVVDVQPVSQAARFAELTGLNELDAATREQFEERVRTAPLPSLRRLKSQGNVTPEQLSQVAALRGKAWAHYSKTARVVTNQSDMDGLLGQMEKRAEKEWDKLVRDVEKAKLSTYKPKSKVKA